MIFPGKFQRHICWISSAGIEAFSREAVLNVTNEEEVGRGHILRFFFFSTGTFNHRHRGGAKRPKQTNKLLCTWDCFGLYYVRFWR
jgi:hypothetical protein